MSYQPSQEILEKYADILVNFALWGGEGIKPGDSVYLCVPTSALPFYTPLAKAITKAGGNIISNIMPDIPEVSRYYYEHATEKQLKNFFGNYLKGLVDDMTHRLVVLADEDPHVLDNVDPKKILTRQMAHKPYMEWLDAKENAGQYTWTLALYGTEKMAKEAGLSLKDYWQQIIKACYLDEADPVQKWREISKEVQRVANTLSKMPITSLHMTGEDVDLTISLGEKRRWMGGSGRNIPSFEVFTSPDWRGTEGWIRFNQPLYAFGQIVEGIELKFEKGRVVSAKAKKNQKLLRQLIETDQGAAQVGEFSLTDKRLSRINKFMATTLFDENMGGTYGNTHIALGRSYHDCYSGTVSKTTQDEFKKLGFNESIIHEDMISTADRTVEATLADGSRKVIYQNGMYAV